MQVRRLFVLLPLLVGMATLSVAQKTVVASPTIQIRVQLKSMVTAAGEPVPGAEILIEQENVQKRASVVTDAQGQAVLTLPSRSNFKFWIKLQPAQITLLKQKAPKADKARLVLAVTAGKKSTEHSAEVVLNSTAQVSSGPFSQSLSNIEDN